MGSRATGSAAIPLDDVPKLPGLPWVGAPRAILSHPGRYLLEGFRLHGPVFRIQLLGMEMVAMIGPAANRFILAERRHAFSNAEGYRIVREVLGEGLLFQDGEVHKRNRALMTPAFHHQGVVRYFDVMLEVVRKHLERWDRAPSGPMYERFRRLTFEIMARLILGVRGDLDLERLSRLNDGLARGTIAFPRWDVPFLPYARGLRARDEVRAYLRRVIRERQADPGDDALGLLMAARGEDGERLSDDELVEQAVILMFAGHETTTSMLSSFLQALGEHPEVEERLRAEQAEVVGDGPLAREQLDELSYLDAVLKEVERLYPPISMCNRGVVEEVEFEGATLPVGTIVTYSPWASHRIAEVFAEPDRFDPERFLPPRREHRATPYGLVGFGGGPRLCIGQPFALLEMKIVASELLRHHRWELDPADPRLRYVPTLHPRTGLPALVRPLSG